MRGLTKKSLVTLNSPPSGRRRMEILTTFSQPQRRYYTLYVVSYRVTCRANGMALCLYLLCIEREAGWLPCAFVSVGILFFRGIGKVFSV